ncbi:MULTISPECIES: endonuclease III [unclassified Mesorhizobium]|uniref:endonuclease III n=1 Tax=unclassified Mesorhizobium TaxID=325217 RepID=UPI000BAFDE67|nr:MULTISPECIES: endonuclease III [unclassified Mesorhizobium]TGT63413.1 endonuclease III [Mesorhizobium sp. M00.F.Ca.ET.170.01.1.1]AZO11497.1 endonuclease III [Mesorhizobium sp. M3A.F.Ca.ET.080.04.2.1]PBB88239.1 endonuclease III [Mesorhizobium sp. WSM3876]RWB67325.1 MAG: endonuclease III [Mesorhizobium sp.]RWB92002.1 MAG: endonuclease III [Mesorhizobium sp.]
MAPPKSKNPAPVKKPSASASIDARPRARPLKGRTRSVYSAAEVHEIFRRFSVQRPEPKGELDYVNAFTLLVAVVLSAQATDVGVNRATRPLFAVADTPQKMLALGEAKVGDYIRTIGLWRNKAKNVIALSKALIDDYGGNVPEDRDELVKLPGVGRKTANVVLNVAFGQHTMAVDTHIFRIGNRIGLAPGKTPEEVEQGLLRVIPAEYMRHAHHWLILHGRYVCKARKPDCPACVIADICKSKEKTTDVPAPLVPIAPLEEAPSAGA